MRLPLLCSECANEGARADDSTVFVPINDTSIYAITCHRGHATTVVVVESRYEQLFEIGLSAIIDEYYREAVVSFASSLERFYEFAFYVLARHAGMGKDLAAATWKPVARQSERQLGAFLGVWVSAERTPPVLLDEKVVAFRNEVVHKGKIPSRHEALQFGDRVLGVIRAALGRLRETYSEAYVAHSLDEQLAVLRAPELEGKKVTRHSLAMALRDLNVDDPTLYDTAFYVRRTESLRRTMTSAAR